MAFTDSEIARMRFELGYNVMDVGAEPYLGITSVFDQVIRENSLSDYATTSSTAVTGNSDPSPSTITISNATGFATGQRVVVDVDTRRETVTIQNLSGTSLTALFTKTHSGTYPVAIESGETIAREILNKLSSFDSERLDRLKASGVKKVDEIEFFGGALAEFDAARNALRNDLASALGVPNRHSLLNRRPSRFEAY